MQQQMLFDFKKNDSICIAEAAEELRVSVASIRNWIKTGYLEQKRRNFVTLSSFETLKKTVIGKDKLNQRANKSLKNVHNHADLERFIDNLIISQSIDIESISAIYESKLSESYKNIEGIFYTPVDIVDIFFSHLPKDCSNLIFCDPCCGTGNFLLGAVKHGFKLSNIYGFDIDETAVKIARKRLAAFSGERDVNVEQGDFFYIIDKNIENKFNVILTNPPWGKKLTTKEKKILSQKIKCEDNIDISALFLLGCMSIIKDNGTLGFLLQDAFFNISAFEGARRKILDYKIKKIIDFGKPFRGLFTKAKGLIVKKELAFHDDIVLCFAQNENHVRPQRSFLRNPKSILNINCTEKDTEVIEHLFSIKHATLKGNAQYGLGIVTGNNKKYCSSELKEGYIPAYRGADITRSGIKKPSMFIPKNLSLYQQVAPINLYFSKEKLIYKFISSELIFYHDQNQIIILNSANMLILDEKFPINHKQLCDILNSRLMSWVFSKLFETHKVLRSDIEFLPIFIDYFNHYPEFRESLFLKYLTIEETENGTYTIKR